MALVRKKDGSTEEWNFNKIDTAVEKSASRINTSLTEDELKFLHQHVFTNLVSETIIPVETIHGSVEHALRIVRPDVADSYANYRNYRKDIVAMLDEIFKKTRDVLYLGDRENANYNSALISTKGSLIRGYLTKELMKKFYLTKEELEAIEDGWVYAHDLKDLLFNGINCCLMDIGAILKNGFDMSGIRYKEPKSLLSAMQVIGDITLVATAQQFGGFTIPELDSILVPYAKKSIIKYKAEAAKYGISNVEKFVSEKLEEEIMQGLQSIEMKLNTVPSSRGDTAFVTVSFANCNVEEDAELQRAICRGILKTRMHGQGNGSPVVFPKLVYLHSKEQHQVPEQEELFNLAIECSSKAMYPDYLSLDHGYVGDIFKETGKVISPMGKQLLLI